EEPSNFRSEESIDEYMKKHGIPGISGIDTRMLARILREKGTMKDRIIMEGEDNALHKTGEYVSDLLVNETSITKPYIVPGKGKRVVVIDLEMKQSILHELMEREFHVTVVPYDYDVDAILANKPDGVLISNGPGNPTQLKQTLE